MTLSLIADVHVPLSIVSALRDAGVDVITAQEDGSGELEDEQLLDRATSLRRVLVTYDRDFWAEAARRQAAGVAFPGVYLVAVRQTVIGPVARDLILAARVLSPSDIADRIEALPLR